MTDDYRMPPLRAEDVLKPMGRLLRAGLPSATAERARRWEDTGGDTPRLSPGGLTSAGIDSMAVAAMRTVMGPSLAREMPTIVEEMREAIDLFEERGWLSDPLSYHREPTAPRMRSEVFHALECQWTRLHFDSGYEPHPGEPGAHRWMDYSANRKAVVSVLRHAEPAPWLVLLHGSFMGKLEVDARVFDPVRLHHDLGYNVLMPVLPLHGERRAKGGLVPRALPSFSALDNVHGIAQAAWDVRRVVAWIRQQDLLPITVYGVSLGAYVAALTGGLLRTNPVDAILAGIPAVDFPSIFTSQMPPRAQTAWWYDGWASDVARVHTPVSVLDLPPPLTPVESLHLYAARHDRVLRPLQQAARLWQHWGRPDVLWVDGGHVLAARNKDVTDFVNHVLDSGTPA